MANYDRLQNDYDFQASFAGLIITGYIVANKKQLDPVGIENLKQAQGLINTQANDKIVKQMVKQIVSQSQVMFQKYDRTIFLQIVTAQGNYAIKDKINYGKEELQMSLHTMSLLYAVFLILFAIGGGIELGVIAITADYYLSISKKYAINLRNLLILTLLIIVITGVMVIHLFATGFISAKVIQIMFAIIGANEVVVLAKIVLSFLIIRKPA